MSFEKQLRDALHQDSEQLVVVGTGTESVKRRAHRRRNRGRAGVATLAAVGVVGAAVAVTQLRPDEEQSTVAVQPSKPAASTPELAWRTVAGTVSSPGQIATPDGAIYVLGTAPGVGDPNNTDPDMSLYRSEDGEHWSSQPLGASKWISSLSERDGVLYGVGTAPGTGTSIGVQLTTSNNEGASWSAATKLPYEFAVPTANVSFYTSSSATGARGANATVVLAAAQFSPNLGSALGNLGEARSYEVTDEGVKILDMSDCDKGEPATFMPAASGAEADAEKRLLSKGCNDPKVVETKPWSDFGITDPAALHPTRVLVSTDGSTWNDVASPLPADAYGGAVHATANGFLITGTIPQADREAPMITKLYASADGRQWNELPALPAGFSLLSKAGDTLVAGDYGMTPNVMVSTDGGATWTTTDVLQLGGPGGEFFMPSAGPLGVAMVVSDQDARVANDTLLYSVDGSTWKSVNLGSVGAPKAGFVNNVRVGADHIEVVYSLNDTPAQKPDTLVTLLATPKAP